MAVMTRPILRRTPVVVCAVIALAVVGAMFAHTGSGSAASNFSFAFVGDVPYSSSDVSRMPALVADIDAAGVGFVAHAGDIKAGDDVCSNSLIGGRFDTYQTFDAAFWYTPGDNEWTDCRDADRNANPLERLAHVRSVFYPNPTRTTGGSPMAVTHQSGIHIENVWFRKQCVTFGSIHQVGSSNGLSSWPNETQFEKELREAEVAARNAANATWVDEIFDRAQAASSKGVFILVHAKPRENSTWGDVTNRIKARAGSFAGPVVIGHGDDHNQNIETSFLGLGNVTRWETEGGNGATREWIKVDIDCSGPTVFSQVVVDVGSTPPTTTTPTTTTVGPTTTTSTLVSSTTVPPTSTVVPGTTTTSVAQLPPDPSSLRLDSGATPGRRAERGERFVIGP